MSNGVLGLLEVMMIKGTYDGLGHTTRVLQTILPILPVLVI